MSRDLLRFTKEARGQSQGLIKDAKTLAINTEFGEES